MLCSIDSPCRLLQACGINWDAHPHPRHIYTNTRQVLQATALTELQDEDATTLHTDLLQLNIALTAYMHAEGATEIPAYLKVPGPQNDFSLLATIAKTVPGTARVLHVRSILAQHQYAVVDTSAKHNSCLFYAVAKSMLATITRCALGYPAFMVECGIDMTKPRPRNLFRSAKHDHFLDNLVSSLRVKVAAWLTKNKGQLRERFAIMGDKYADREMKDIDTEIEALNGKGWVGDKGAMTTLRTVLEEEDRTWWTDTGFKMLYFGNSSAGPGIAGNIIEVLPWNTLQGVDQYCQAPQDKTWPSRASSMANNHWGLKTPSVMHAAIEAGQRVAIFSNIMPGHFEAILHKPDEYSDATKGHICYYMEEVVVATMPTVEGVRYYTEVPRLSELPDPRPLRGAALVSALGDRLYPTESWAPDASDDEDDAGAPSKSAGPSMRSRSGSRRGGAGRAIKPAAPAYDFANHLPEHFAAAVRDAEKSAHIFATEYGEEACREH